MHFVVFSVAHVQHKFYQNDRLEEVAKRTIKRTPNRFRIHPQGWGNLNSSCKRSIGEFKILRRSGKRHWRGASRGQLENAVARAILEALKPFNVNESDYFLFHQIPFTWFPRLCSQQSQPKESEEWGRQSCKEAEGLRFIEVASVCQESNHEVPRCKIPRSEVFRHYYQ